MVAKIPTYFPNHCRISNTKLITVSNNKSRLKIVFYGASTFDVPKSVNAFKVRGFKETNA
jgi:uncharacterized secreted protein with C-terminal beta-propeller domain